MLVMPARPGTFIAHFTARGPPALKERLAADLSRHPHRLAAILRLQFRVLCFGFTFFANGALSLPGGLVFRTPRLLLPHGSLRVAHSMVSLALLSLLCHNTCIHSVTANPILCLAPSVIFSPPSLSFFSFLFPAQPRLRLSVPGLCLVQSGQEQRP